jgi:hypothetical protein
VAKSPDDEWAGKLFVPDPRSAEQMRARKHHFSGDARNTGFSPGAEPVKRLGKLL